jgi:hypothetical protein
MQHTSCPTSGTSLYPFIQMRAALILSSEICPPCKKPKLTKFLVSRYWRLGWLLSCTWAIRPKSFIESNFYLLL